MKRLSHFALAFGCLAAVSICVSQAGATVVFSTDFEYSGGEPVVGNDAVNLNGADGQIGSFSGALPDGAGGQFAPGLMGFADHPDNGTRLLWVDRPVENASFFADLASPVLVDGATVFLEVGSRRTQGNHSKDYDIIGWDSGGNESFHLRVSTRNTVSATPTNDAERLAVVTDNGATVTYDLPTVAGADADADLDNLGGLPFDTNEIGAIALSMGGGGYVIDFTNADGSNFYTTDTIAYNGPATVLSRIEFTVAGGGANGIRSGYVLDNISVEGAIVPEPSTLAMTALALAGLAALGYRKRRK